MSDENLMYLCPVLTTPNKEYRCVDVPSTTGKVINIPGVQVEDSVIGITYANGRLTVTCYCGEEIPAEVIDDAVVHCPRCRRDIVNIKIQDSGVVPMDPPALTTSPNPDLWCDGCWELEPWPKPIPCICNTKRLREESGRELTMYELMDVVSG